MNELAGMSILVVEDEPLVAMALEGVLTDRGCHVVGPALNLDQGMQLVRNGALDGAVLDVNLGAGIKVFPLADQLAQGSIPFVYVTGYGKAILRDVDEGRPVLQKPYDVQQLVKIIAQHCRR